MEKREGLQAWLPSEQQTANFFKCQCTETYGAMCYSPEHRYVVPASRVAAPEVEILHRMLPLVEKPGWSGTVILNTDSELCACKGRFVMYTGLSESFMHCESCGKKQ